MTVPALKEEIEELKTKNESMKVIIHRQFEIIESMIGYFTAIEENMQMILKSIAEAKKHSGIFVFKMKQELQEVDDDRPTSGGTG